MNTYKAAAWLDDGHRRRGGGVGGGVTLRKVFIPGPVTQKCHL